MDIKINNNHYRKQLKNLNSQESEEIKMFSCLLCLDNFKPRERTELNDRVVSDNVTVKDVITQQFSYHEVIKKLNLSTKAHSQLQINIS